MLVVVPVVLRDLKNMSMAVGLSMLSFTPQADIDVISYQLPVNSHHLGFPGIPRYWTVLRSSPAVLPSPENMGIACVISLLSYIQAKINVMSYLLLVRAAIFKFSLVCSSPVVLPSSDNMGIAGGILLLSRIQAEMYVISCLLPV